MCYLLPIVWLCATCCLALHIHDSLRLSTVPTHYLPPTTSSPHDACTVTELGPILPVSRSWDFVKNPADTDWGYVIFDWDNIFATYMTSLDPSAKNISYSNFIQVAGWE